MSLQGSVMCNCFKEGKAKQPPIERDRIYFEDGYAAFRYSHDMPLEQRNEIEGQLLEWQKTACPHEDMYAVYAECYQRNAYIFTQIITAIGKYPELLAVYPSGNDGNVPLERVKQAARQLEYFCSELPAYTGTFLTDVLTDANLYIHFSGNALMVAGLWLNEQGFKMQFDADGFYITDILTDRELFRSREFTKRPDRKIESISPSGYHQFVQTMIITDLKSGNTCVVPDFLEGKDHLKIVKRPFQRDDLYCMEPLKKLFQASLETGNPIQWH